MVKQRLDELLVALGLVETRSKAKALIMTGNVLVNDLPVDKAGALVATEANIRLRDQQKYVGRGGIKLEAALRDFKIDVANKVCLDVGASTGGFTDCLLQHGAKKVWAVDVGQNQLHWKLKTDSRVLGLEGINFRHMDLAILEDPIDVVVMDVSFISIKLLIPKIVSLLKLSSKKKQVVFLIKPQFEVGKELVGKGGIVRDEKARDTVVSDVVTFCKESGFENLKTMPSPITGADGNVEFLLAANFLA